MCRREQSFYPRSAAATPSYARRPDCATPSIPESKEWRSLDVEHKKAWLLHFWDKSSALAGTSVMRRIAEHYERLAKAEQYYGVVSGEEHFGIVVTDEEEGHQQRGLLSMLLGG